MRHSAVREDRHRRIHEQTSRTLESALQKLTQFVEDLDTDDDSWEAEFGAEDSGEYQREVEEAEALDERIEREKWEAVVRVSERNRGKK